MTVNLRLMQLADLPAVLELKDQAGWNQVPRDLERFLACSPSGCFVAEREGKVVGSVTTVRYEKKFAWIGMVLVDTEHRRQGIGRQLLEAAIECVGRDCKTIKLDATPDGKQVYDTLEFVDECPLERWVRPGGAPAPEDVEAASTLAQARSRDLAELLTYDAPIFGAIRTFILGDWFRAMRETAWLARDRQGRLVGYLLGREGSRYRQLGPLVADDEATARALLTEGIRASGQDPLVIDIPMHTFTWLDWLDELGFERSRQLIRMCRGPKLHSGDPARQWAICGPEWG